MDSLMFVITFGLGAVVLLVAIIALLKKKGDDTSGSLEFGGFKLAGTGAPAVFLLVGVVLMLTGVNGYAAIEKNEHLTSANRNLRRTVSAAESTVAVERSKAMIFRAQLTPQQLKAIAVQNPNLFAPVQLQNPQAVVPANPGGASH